MTIEMIPFTKLKTSSANPRKYFDEALITSLSESIKTDGLLQNLVVMKPKGKKSQPYIIISGERRFRALGYLVEKGELPSDVAVPAEVKVGLSEDEVLRIATVENIQRENLTPLEEAEALKILSRSGDTLDCLCAQTGLSSATIRRRLALLNLSEAVKREMVEGALSLAQAEALSLASHEKQERMFRGIENGWYLNATSIKDELLSSKPSIAKAIFPLESYTGTMTIDLFAEDESSYFDDEQQFFDLQKEAAENLVEEYEQSHDWAEFTEGHFYSHEYDEVDEDEKGGVIICLKANGEVETYVGLVKAPVHETVKIKRPIATYSKPLCRYMAMHKSMALQAELLKNPRTAKEVMTCTMLADMRVHGCLQFLEESQVSGLAYEMVNAEALEVLNILGHKGKDASWRDLQYLYHAQGEAYETVRNLTDDDLDRVATLFVTMRAGQEFADRLDTHADSFFNSIASNLKIDMCQYWKPDVSFLKRRNKIQLAEIIKEVGATAKFATLSVYKKGEIVDKLGKHFIDAHLSKKPNGHEKKALNWLPEAMQFPAINPDSEKEK